MNKNITIIKNEKSWIESGAIDQLTKVAELHGIIQAVGLPDLHPGKTPIGAAFLTSEVIYPHIVGNDIGCGLALFSLGIPRNKFKTERVVKRLNQLDSIEEIDVTGLIADYSFPFKEKMGTIGSGNHFAEFQIIDKVFNQEAFQRIGLDDKEVMLLIHSGSRTYGEYILDKYIKEFSCQKGLFVGTDGFNCYMKEHQQALEFAKLNRELIAFRITSALNLKTSLKVLDTVHNGLFEKEIDGKKHFIHRKGAAPSDQGFVVVAGSRGTNSYIVEPDGELTEYLFSVSHGAGRKWPRVGCKERLEKMFSKKSLRQDSLMTPKVIYKDKNLFYEEAPEAYKNIERVIEDMLQAGMIKLVAGLSPLVTYKV